MASTRRDSRQPATPREIDALLGASRAAEEKADQYASAVMGCFGGWCNKVIDERQLQEYPATTLLVARACKVALIFFICVCTLGLLTGFLFQGSLELLEEVNQVDMLPAPRLAICPQPWGSSFATQPNIVADLMTFPSGERTPLHPKNYTTVACPVAVQGCKCTDFTSVELKPRGEKRGELTSWQYIRAEFKAANKDPKLQQFAFGFYDQNLPQQWTYANFGAITEGDVRYEEVAHGKTEFTDGVPVTRYVFRLAGESTEKHGSTVLLFGYDRFLAYVIASVGSKWSLFSVMTLLITFCAAVNNFGLFEIFFPEKLDDSNPAQLVPSPALSGTCGSCCICCLPREGQESDKESV